MTRYTLCSKMYVSNDNGEWIPYDDYRRERELWIEALIAAGVGTRMEIECAPLAFAARHRKEVDAMREKMLQLELALVMLNASPEQEATR
jgi:hypothetical protein